MTEQVKKPIWKKWWFWTIWIILIIVANAQQSGGNTAETANSNEAKKSAPAAAPAKTAGIGDTVKSKYFDVTVNSISFSKVVGNNEFTRTSAGDGNHFAVINVTFKNTDTEGRSLSAGELFADYSGKELKFDDAEMIPEEGFISFDTLNPLTKVTGNVVFKLPEELKAGLKYAPPRSDVTIKLQ